MNNISITFRHVDPSDAIKAHAEEKVQKLQRFLRQPMSARITLSLEKLEQGAEIRISSGGEHLEAHEVCEDMYMAIDRAVQKLERQISGSKGSAQSKQRRGGSSLREAVSPEPAATTSDVPPES
ncbi:MAG TPA: ribosome-associated translation inhibitor RaiA [Polyangiaceae bacterium]|jgi:putative sigma-54 modulation protein|nr:ribosome-associated translation inhibitor RaiA [Polyangiaceae bacterium]